MRRPLGGPPEPPLPRIPEDSEDSGDSGASEPENPEILKIPQAPCRKIRRFRSSRRPRTTILGRFCDRFSSFFEVTSRERLDSYCKGPNLCFCRQARYFRGFADFTKTPKIHENWRKLAPTSICERVARNKLDFSAPGRDLASNLVASACSRVLLGDLSGVLGLRWGAAEHSQGASGTL